MHWKDCAIHVVDFEGSRNSGVVEFGLVTLWDGEIAACATRLCRPRGEITPQERAQHGIVEDEARLQEPFAAEWDRFVNLRKSGPMAAHHAMVENGFLKAQWAYPPASPDFLHEGRTLADWGPWIDTRQLYARVYPGLEGYGLSELVGSFGLQERLDTEADRLCPERRGKYHCALYDALASALLLLRLGGEEGFENMSIPWLLTQSQASGEKRQAASQGGLFE
ncbi:3'-5' exonuclease [Ruficoccus amylovorans]|uniref:3'-5' exonuclease n=1 Tax=Ruficoccus amylovorans TaxID=1804625 RepID=A0A842H9D5_9BACT|nr:3'-5' exonuclease [Ruficoccus amylovorans]MBC2593032.1 3'-5' exonuclease [Ruficoccus amylovorans]